MEKTDIGNKSSLCSHERPVGRTSAPLPALMLLIICLTSTMAAAQMARFGRHADPQDQAAGVSKPDAPVNYCYQPTVGAGLSGYSPSERKIIDAQKRIVAVVKHHATRFRLPDPVRELTLLKTAESYFRPLFQRAAETTGPTGRKVNPANELMLLGYCRKLQQRLQEDGKIAVGFERLKKHYEELFSANMKTIDGLAKETPRSFKVLKNIGRIIDKRRDRSQNLDELAGQLNIPQGEKIIRGSLVKRDSLLHVVAFGAGELTSCTGTLIGPRAVLTAAHCFCQANGRANFRSLEIVIGNNTARPNDIDTHSIAYGALYDPKFCKILGDNSYLPTSLRGRDMALVILKKPVKQKPALIVNPVVQLLAPSRPREMQIVGFGKDEYGRVGRKLRATVPVEDYLCAAPDTYDCAKGAEIVLKDEVGGRDTCNGDSGGPVFYGGPQDPGFKVLVGVTSRGVGRSCGDGGIYSLITPGVVNWICRWNDAVELKMFGDNSPCN